MKIAVCDENRSLCRQLEGWIDWYFRKENLPLQLNTFFSVEQFLQCLAEKPYFDIIFLDILMKGMDGMETARRCRELSFEKTLIFLSSSRSYVFDAYDVEAFHYLVKPVEDEKLKNVLKRAVERERQHSSDYMVVSRERQRRKLFLDSVRYFEIRGRQINVHEEKESFTYYEQIGNLEKKLTGKGFFRCHKSYLLNLKHVEAYNRQEAILDNGERILIAKRRYESFCKEILAYMRKNGGIQ